MEITPIPSARHAAGKGAYSGLTRWIAAAGGGVEAAWRALVSRTRRPKSLVLIESSALGDRRFVSVVQFERQRFLVGSSPSSVTLLARLPNVREPRDEGMALAGEGESQ